MKLILPPGLSERGLNRALDAFAGVTGREWVLRTDEDRETYLDVYAPGNEASHAPSAAVAPATTEEVQAIVRLANEHHVPLWPISRGKNFGYGGAAPRMPGCVVLDLGRMKRILEVNERYGYCVVEPGVGFYDLHEYLQSRKLPLWLSVPGNGWGSVMGNALERGFSATPYGDHGAQICGMEVVLPGGELLRTGMGAMSRGTTGPMFHHGFGPSWDQMFVQSHYGVVTKMGMWLMPAPEATLSMSMKLPDPEDLGWLVDVLAPLRLRGIVNHNVSVQGCMASATMSSQRKDWYQGEGALPDSVLRAIMAKHDVGWWNFTLRLYGDPEVNEANARLIQKAFAARTTLPFTIARWSRAESGTIGGPAPGVFPLQIVNWHGGRGGHIGFSPVLPPDGKLVVEQLRLTRQRFREAGIDYSGTFYISGRHVINVNLIIYDRDNAGMTQRVRGLFGALVKDSAAAGYAEYRTHLSYMDEVAATFDFNGHALRRLNETVKDALDPNGILAPGRNGIWPARYRGQRGTG